MEDIKSSFKSYFAHESEREAATGQRPRCDEAWRSESWYWNSGVEVIFDHKMRWNLQYSFQRDKWQTYSDSLSCFLTSWFRGHLEIHFDKLVFLSRSPAGDSFFLSGLLIRIFNSKPIINEWLDIWFHLLNWRKSRKSQVPYLPVYVKIRYFN